MSAEWVQHPPREGPDEALFLISFVAEETGLHPQTLRQYDRLGLVSPSRARGRGRRYTERDVHNLRRVQQLTAEGVNLAGVKRVLELEAEVRQLREDLLGLAGRLGARPSGRPAPEESYDEPSNLPVLRLTPTTAVVRWIHRS